MNHTLTTFANTGTLMMTTTTSTTTTNAPPPKGSNPKEYFTFIIIAVLIVIISVTAALAYCKARSRRRRHETSGGPRNSQIRTVSGIMGVDVNQFNRIPVENRPTAEISNIHPATSSSDIYTDNPPSYDDVIKDYYSVGVLNPAFTASQLSLNAPVGFNPAPVGLYPASVGLHAAPVLASVGDLPSPPAYSEVDENRFSSNNTIHNTDRQGTQDSPEDTTNSGTAPRTTQDTANNGVAPRTTQV
ncbi:uncharacterized protein LOC141902314 [Tubulanus polymorphus]|uniref:uncharacterized protein LOC141902314 n=1 Tax=Tubulanus polymorphus TaxID=672921 RepID=UPI003DA5EEA4